MAQSTPFSSSPSQDLYSPFHLVATQQAATMQLHVDSTVNLSEFAVRDFPIDAKDGYMTCIIKNNENKQVARYIFKPLIATADDYLHLPDVVVQSLNLRVLKDISTRYGPAKLLSPVHVALPAPTWDKPIDQIITAVATLPASLIDDERRNCGLLPVQLLGDVSARWAKGGVTLRAQPSPSS